MLTWTRWFLKTYSTLTNAYWHICSLILVYFCCAFHSKVTITIRFNFLPYHWTFLGWEGLVTEVVFFCPRNLHKQRFKSSHACLMNKNPTVICAQVNAMCFFRCIWSNNLFRLISVNERERFYTNFANHGFVSKERTCTKPVKQGLDWNGVANKMKLNITLVT